MIFIVQGLLVGLLSATFAFTAQARSLDPISSGEQQARLERLNHQPYDGQARELVIAHDSSCKQSLVELNVFDVSTGQQRLMRVLLFMPDYHKRVPAVLVVPTILGPTILEYSAATKLCESDMAAIIVDVISKEPPEAWPAWERHDVVNVFAVHALRTTLDWAQTKLEIDPDQLGAIGFSLGGIVTAMLASAEPRLKAVFLGAAGGNLPAILTNSQDKEVARLRRTRLPYVPGGTLEGHQELLRQNIEIDPVYFAAQVPQEKVMMLLVNGDIKVPYENQLELWNSYGQPHHIVYNHSHAGSLIRFVYLGFSTLRDFLNRRFGR